MTLARFDYFILLAGMRTGSNFLEANINRLPDLACHGEAFNPTFIGYPNKDELLGVTLAQREADPNQLISAIKATDQLGGFRFFHDHDPRIIDQCLNDARCAKIVLTRNPLDSFISWKIAKATGQWKLTNVTRAKSEKVAFDRVEFEKHLKATSDFQRYINSTLQKTGQTAFHIAYDDLHDLDIFNGLAAFLGSEEELASLDRKLKKQNPDGLETKVSNYDQMRSELADMDLFNLDVVSNFEPLRGPMIPAYVAAAHCGLLYMPLRSGPDQAIVDWLAAVDTRGKVLRKFTQASLRDWRRSHATHRSFAVLRHPVARAHTAFCKHIVFNGPGCFEQLRKSLRKVHALDIPETPPRKIGEEGYDLAAHYNAFMGFLTFLKGNLAAQTSIRVDPAWASQLTLLQGIAQFSPPDFILREETLHHDLPMIAAQVGVKHVPDYDDTPDDSTRLLSQIYDSKLESAARNAYHRDFATFGFTDWA